MKHERYSVIVGRRILAESIYGRLVCYFSVQKKEILSLKSKRVIKRKVLKSYRTYCITSKNERLTTLATKDVKLAYKQFFDKLNMS